MFFGHVVKTTRTRNTISTITPIITPVTKIMQQ